MHAMTQGNPENTVLRGRSQAQPPTWYDSIHMKRPE